MGKRGDRARHRLAVLSWANLAALVLLWLAETFVAERAWPTILLTYMPQGPLLAPVAPLLLVSLFRREGRACLVNLGAAAFGLVALLGFRWALPPLVATTDPVVRVMSFNIEHGKAGAAKIAEAVRDARPDIVCFQETNAYQQLPDPVPGLRRALGGAYPFFARHGELLIVSRHALVGQSVLPLAQTRTRRPALQAVLEVEGQQVTIINVHLATAVSGASLANRRVSLPSYLRETAAVRAEQVSALRGWARAVETPLIIAGDFNTPPRGRVYRSMTRSFADAFARRGRGGGYTFPADRPQMRIDYLWTANGARAQSAVVWPVRISDHRPLVAEISLPQL